MSRLSPHLHRDRQPLSSHGRQTRRPAPHSDDARLRADLRDVGRFHAPGERVPLPHLRRLCGALHGVRRLLSGNRAARPADAAVRGNLPGLRDVVSPYGRYGRLTYANGRAASAVMSKPAKSPRASFGNAAAAIIAALSVDNPTVGKYTGYPIDAAAPRSPELHATPPETTPLPPSIASAAPSARANNSCTPAARNPARP